MHLSSLKETLERVQTNRQTALAGMCVFDGCGLKPQDFIGVVGKLIEFFLKRYSTNTSSTKVMFHMWRVISVPLTHIMEICVTHSVI